VSIMLRPLQVFVATLALGACATTGATFRSGVGDKMLDHPPYYAGDAVASDTSPIGHLPITLQRGASQSPIFDPKTGAGSLIDRLLVEMNAYLDSLGTSKRIGDGARAGTPPDVRFGCVPALGIPGNDCAERDDIALGRNAPGMQISVGRPSPEWIAWNRDAAEAAHTERTLVVTLEVGQYLLRQEGLRGTKVLELGTGYRAQFPWLTSLETPVTVLQLTGALVGRDGKAIRIGAEGFYARRTRLLVSAIGGQEVLTEADVEAVRSAKREDLPGAPIAWKVALMELVSGVTGRTSRVR